ncbi:MAG: hypothetical protein ACFFC7_22790 [Candidatus Hermodarchaeota archaeon]
MTLKLFDYIILDTNFFINLETAGLLEQILPDLNKIASNVGMTPIIPEEIPKSDIPGKFRQLRHIIPKYVKMDSVNRKSKLWRQTAQYAIEKRLVTADKDPVDIDCIVLAANHAFEGKKTAVVSDDAGVARVLEFEPFQMIKHLSCGSFVSILAASVKQEELRKLLDIAAKKVFRVSWDYRKRTRRYIDIKMLVEDLTDTAQFVRAASQLRDEESGFGTPSSAAPISPEPEYSPVIIEPSESLMKAQELVNHARQAREQSNIQKAEQIIFEILMQSSTLIFSIPSLEDRIIIETLFKAELFEHHTWLLRMKLQWNDILDALVHAEACLVYMNLISVNREIIESMVALQGLLYLLHGHIERALDLFRMIPRGEGEEVSLTQLLGLVVSLIAANREDEALKLMNIHPKFVEGLISSIGTYANDLFYRKQHSIAIAILRFIALNFTDSISIHDTIERLFIMTRLRPDLIKGDTTVQSLFASVLGKQAIDNSSYPIPRHWSQQVRANPELPLESDKKDPRGMFKGYYHILELEYQEKDDEIVVIAWNEANKSTWRLIFPAAYLPALEKSIKIRLTSGRLVKLKPDKKDKIVRGTLFFEEPVIQPEFIQWWE